MRRITTAVTAAALAFSMLALALPAAAVTGYDGKPTDYQVARTESLGHELQDVIDDFQKLSQKDLTGINAGLKKKKLQPIRPLDRKTWDATESDSGASAPPAGRFFQERD